MHPDESSENLRQPAADAQPLLPFVRESPRRGIDCCWFAAMSRLHEADTSLNPALLKQYGRQAGRGSERESSPGWTRTSNPPVNSRMLCQLSYAGTQRA